ncbi:NADH-quinone oxidoreductase subunit H [Candidatus Hepatincolaceae symbiont of Richtersius coronifer]
MLYISQLIDSLAVSFLFWIWWEISIDVALGFALFLKVLLVILVIMLCVAYLTWLERKIHGLIHIRKGPNVVGPLGLMQPLADGLKLFLKELIIPNNSNKLIFLMAPVVSFMLALVGWAVIPIEEGIVLANINVGVLYLMATSSLGVYGIIMAGWASNSQYAFLGAIRSSAQMISYEISMGLIIVCVVLLAGSFNLTEIVMAQKDLWYFVKIFPMAILFFIVILAETNRHPFDLPEAESDIVSGYHTEYSGFSFALFFLAEYANMMLMSSFYTILFLGGWLPLFNFWFFAHIPGFIWFIMKVLLLLILMIQLRSVLPRYRYDQLMRLGWKVFLPLALAFVVFLACLLRFTNTLPTI